MRTVTSTADRGAIGGQILAIATVAFAVLLGALALSNEAGPGSNVDGEVVSGRDSVAVLGDSITVDAEDAMRARLGDSYNLAVDAVAGLTTTEQIAGADRLAARAVPTDQLVVNLGTNDVSFDVPLAESRRSLEAIIGRFGEARCIHLVTITDKARDQDPVVEWTEAVRFNEMLRTLAGDPRVRFVEWAAVLDANDSDGGGSFLNDRVHPNEAGQVALSDAVGESLAGCGAAG